MSTRVLIVSHDVVDRHMAGPAIRCWEMARALGREFPVTLAVPNPTQIQGDGFTVVRYDGATLRRLATQADLIVVSGFLLVLYPFLKETGVPLVVDLYDPFHLENLQALADEALAERLRDHEGLLRVLHDQVTVGDFFLCASERQRDFWLGVLSAWNRINPYTTTDDATLRRLIDVVPFGLPVDPPQRLRPVLKGVHPQIAADDRLVLWGGGIYDWLDPLTAIRAVDQVIRVLPNLRFFFMGIRHPNPLVRPMRMVDRARRLSDELGLTDRVVFFNDWVPYEERGAYLLEADVGLSLHLEHLETRFAFRTRLLDCIWAGLPMVVTRGDALADVVEQYGLGTTVGIGDVDGVAAALRVLLEDPQARQRRLEGFRAAAEAFRWEEALRPLVAFARAPHHAADSGGEKPPSHSTVGKVRAAWRRGGLCQLARETAQYFRWRLGGSRE